MLVEAREATTLYRPQTFSPFETRKNPVETKGSWKETLFGLALVGTGFYLARKGLTSDSFLAGALYFGVGTYLLYQGIKRIRHKS